MAKKMVVVSDGNDTLWKVLRLSAGLVVGAAALGGIGFWLARDQMERHQSDLFSPHPMRRLAALGHLRRSPGVDNVLLLRDFLAWEERPHLRKKAATILESMERQLSDQESMEGP